MTPRFNKFALTAHVTLSVGWLGAVAAYLCLAIAGLTSRDAQVVRSAYVSMGLIGWFVIVPFSLAALLTGLIQSLGTKWGVFRYWWVFVKFVLTTAGTIVLLRHMGTTVSRVARVAAEPTRFGTDMRSLQIQLVNHAVGGLLVLLAATILSVYKPWGMTPYGRRKLPAEPGLPARALSPGADLPVTQARSPVNTPRWVNIVGIHAIGLVVVLVVLHLTGAGLRLH